MEDQRETDPGGPKIIDEYPFRARSAAYPWDEWLDGQIRVLEPGKHFTCKPASLVLSAYKAARSRGLKVSASIDNGNVVIQRRKDG